MQASKCAGERTTLALKPMGRVTQSPRQGQSVAPQNGPWSNKKILKNEKKLTSSLLNILYKRYLVHSRQKRNENIRQ